MDGTHDALRERYQGRQHSHRHSQGMGKTNLIIVYTVIVCLSCLYLETQHFQHLLGDRRARYMAWLTYLDVFMCLLSYWQTIRIGNLVPKLSRLEPKGPPTEKFYDYEYSPTHKGCTICQNFKFPRVHHCSTCGSCQYKMDHHCIWTQTCIGYSNQKSFYLFCFYMSIGVFQFWYFSYRVVSERIGSFWHLVEPGVMILWGFTTFSVFFVGLMIIVLFISHTIMMLTNHSTLDSMKAKKMCPMPFCQKGPSPSSINLFDRGELQNLKLFLGKDWWLWLIPTAREIENEIYPQPMTPHPDPQTLMKNTNLYELELKYREEMRKLPSINFLPFFVGKKMRINDQVFLIQEEEKLKEVKAAMKKGMEGVLEEEDVMDCVS